EPGFADAYYARAFVHEITGDYDQAIADFERVIELAPATGDELVVQTDADGGPARVIRLKTGVTWEEGMAAAGAGLDIVRVCNRRGIGWGEAHDFERAIEAFGEGLRRSPFGDDPDQPWTMAHPAGLYFERGRCHSFLGRLEEAVADLTKAT